VTTLYGIKNCDTVKKARIWLDDNNVDYHFHDFREQGIDKKIVSGWVKQLGWETVVNKRSTTWKQMDASSRDNMTEVSAIAAVLENPTLVKRPLLDINGQYSVGFKASDYEARF
jgi:Spx/MgsR family transcriptional regulator